MKLRLLADLDRLDSFESVESVKERAWFTRFAAEPPNWSSPVQWSGATSRGNCILIGWAPSPPATEIIVQHFESSMFDTTADQFQAHVMAGRNSRIPKIRPLCSMQGNLDHITDAVRHVHIVKLPQRATTR